MVYFLRVVRLFVALGRSGFERTDGARGWIVKGVRRMKAFVLIKVEPGKVKEVLDRLQGISQVKEAYCITGPDDIIAVLEAPDAKSISDVVIVGLHEIEGVRGTDTRMVVDIP